MSRVDKVERLQRSALLMQQEAVGSRNGDLNKEEISNVFTRGYVERR